MSMPNIPDINIDREDAIDIVISSVGMQELGLAHIINAEGEKIQSFLGTTDGQRVKDDIPIYDLIKLDKSIVNTISAVTNTELMLLLKLQKARKLLKFKEKEKTSLSGQIVWVDQTDVNKARPAETTVNLFQNGMFFKKKTVSSLDNQFTFNYLPIFDENEQAYVYTVSQNNIPGYNTSIADTVITNTLKKVYVKTVYYDSTNDIEIANESFAVFYGGNVSIYSKSLVGYSVIPPTMATLTNIRDDTTYTFYYNKL